MMFYSRCTDVPYSSKPNTLTQATVGAVCDGEMMNNNSCRGFCLSFSLIEKKTQSTFTCTQYEVEEVMTKSLGLNIPSQKNSNGNLIYVIYSIQGNFSIPTE